MKPTLLSVNLGNKIKSFVSVLLNCRPLTLQHFIKTFLKRGCVKCIVK